MSSTPQADPTSTQTFGAVDAPVVVSGAAVALTAQDRAAVAGLAPRTALLVVSSGPSVGARFLLDSDTTTVGRHPRADIFLDDVTVSRKHAVFVLLPDGGFMVRDSGSLNGTYVNRQRVEEARLASGDEVQIGRYRMGYFCAPEVGERG